MTTGEMAFLIFSVASFVVFAVVLAWASHQENPRRD